jgi:hypothetical protein
MRKFGWLLIIIIFGLGFIGLVSTPSSAPPVAKLDPALTEHMPPLIRKMGMRCGAISRMTLQAKTERGDVFKAICDEATYFYQYRILYTPAGNMTIRPWSE